MTEQTDESREPEIEETELNLPQTNDFLDFEKQYQQIIFVYDAAVRQIVSKLDILNREFQMSNDRNPIENIKSRIKSQESILKKMEKRGLPLSYPVMTQNIFDIGGIRVICPFITDVYLIARLLISQDDIELLEVKDYIQNPKENGYRSLHMIVTVDVRLAQRRERVPVEIQLRTIAMNFWASTEHQLRYKKDYTFTPEMHAQLKECADIMASADEKMQKLAQDLKLSDVDELNW